MCPPSVVARTPPRTRGACASFILDQCKSLKNEMQCSCVCVCGVHTRPGRSSCAKARDPTVPLCKKNNSSVNKGTGHSLFSSYLQDDMVSLTVPTKPNVPLQGGSCCSAGLVDGNCLLYPLSAFRAPTRSRRSLSASPPLTFIYGLT